MSKFMQFVKYKIVYCEMCQTINEYPRFAGWKTKRKMWGKD